MSINLGIVGLPNVGKSTLFNALCAAGAESANFPFCTIAPNVGVVEVPDPRLAALARLYTSRSVVPTSLEFVDIAGLVRGASTGEGLGNQFLAHIRQVDAIVQVVRCFDSDDIVHVDGSVNPVRDVEIIETELLLADLQTVERRSDRAQKQAKAPGAAGEPARAEQALLARLAAHLGRGEPARTLPREGGEERSLSELGLMTGKPTMFVANVGEDEAADSSGNRHVAALRQLVGPRRSPCLTISAAIEAELSRLEPADRTAYLADLGLAAPGLHQVIRAGYRLLDRITFLTAGPQETRAWTIAAGTRAPQAAGAIHSDFERGFIRAEVMQCDDLLRLGSEAAVRSAGALRVEGKDYVVADGDVMNFRFNV